MKPNYAELAAQLDGLFTRCKDFPETNPAAMAALLDLRKLTPEVIAALRQAAADQDAWFVPPRLDTQP